MTKTLTQHTHPFKTANCVSNFLVDNNNNNEQQQRTTTKKKNNTTSKTRQQRRRTIQLQKQAITHTMHVSVCEWFVVITHVCCLQLPLPEVCPCDDDEQQQSTDQQHQSTDQQLTTTNSKIIMTMIMIYACMHVYMYACMHICMSQYHTHHTNTCIHT